MEGGRGDGRRGVAARRVCVREKIEKTTKGGLVEQIKFGGGLGGRLLFTGASQQLSSVSTLHSRLSACDIPLEGWIMDGSRRRLAEHPVGLI